MKLLDHPLGRHSLQTIKKKPLWDVGCLHWPDSQPACWGRDQDQMHSLGLPNCKQLVFDFLGHRLDRGHPAFCRFGEKGDSSWPHYSGGRSKRVGTAQDSHEQDSVWEGAASVQISQHHLGEDGHQLPIGPLGQQVNRPQGDKLQYLPSVYTIWKFSLRSLLITLPPPHPDSLHFLDSAAPFCLELI